MHLSSLVAYAAVGSVEVYLLFIFAPINCGVLYLVLVLMFSMLSPSSFAVICEEERERAGCFAFIVFLMACGC